MDANLGSPTLVGQPQQIVSNGRRASQRVNTPLRDAALEEAAAMEEDQQIRKRKLSLFVADQQNDSSQLTRGTSADSSVSMSSMYSTTSTMDPASSESSSNSATSGNAQSMQQLHTAISNEEGMHNYLFNLILLKGISIKNSGNGFKENSNVYAVMDVGQYRHTSKICLNNSNPVWNQQFQFPVQSPIDPMSSSTDMYKRPSGRVLTVRLYDHDEIFEHEFLGRIEIDLDDLIADCSQDSGKVSERTGQISMKRSKTFKETLPLTGVECGQIQIQYRVEYHFKKQSINFF